ncbi:MAG: glycosyltransferase [bacterium]
MPNQRWVEMLKKLMRRRWRDDSNHSDRSSLPLWKPSWLESHLFKIRDRINSGRIERVVRQHNLEDFDIYHFEGGIDPYRDGRWVKRLAAKGKHIVSFYHGTDLRERGLIEEVYRNSSLHLTSELDLLDKIPGMKYLPLPVDTEAISPAHPPSGDFIRIGHSARNRFKGTEIVIKVVEDLRRSYPVELVLMVNIPHSQVLKIKSTCHIYIDQLTDRGGWGYGASSLEALAMGIPTVTLINPFVERFLGDHPFINANVNTLRDVLIKIIENPHLREESGRKGREWVVRNHSIEAVMDKLYGYYQELGWI